MFGEIYGEIVETYAQPIGGGPTLLEQQLRSAVRIFIQAKNYDQIERRVRLEDVVRAGISALRNGLDHELRQYLPLGYDEYVLYGKECDPLKLELLGMERQQAILTVILQVMEAMHDAWVKEHLRDLGDDSQKFQAMDDKFKQMFMPLQFLEWKLVRRYYQMAMALLKGCGPLPEESTVERCYELQVKKFCQQNGIQDEKTLCDALMRGVKFYPALSSKAGGWLARKQIARRMARVIIQSGVRLN